MPTIKNIMERVALIKPNVATEAQAIEWMNEVDKLIHNNIHITHDGFEDAVEPAYISVDDELLVGAPYDGMYVWWYCSKIDLMNQEIGLYSNNAQLFNTAYSEYRNWVNKYHMPKTESRMHYDGRNCPIPPARGDQNAAP